MTTSGECMSFPVLPAHPPNVINDVIVGEIARHAEELRLGDLLAFARDRDQPFQITPVRGDERTGGHRSIDLVWGQVVQLGRLGHSHHWWRPPTFLVWVCCEFAPAGSIATTLFNDSPILLRPRPPSRPDGTA